MMNDVKKHHEFEKEIHEIMKGYDYEVVYTSSVEESQRFLRRLKKPTRIYAIGGDGTINALIQPLVKTQHEVVILPLGTGNDFSRVLTQTQKPKEILRSSLSKESTAIDVIQLNDLYYVNAACFGVDSVIATHVHDTPDIPLVPESKSYIVSILQHVFKYNYDEVTLMSDDQILYQGQVTLCTLNNAQYYGGGFRITPQADIKDGYMDICVVDKVNKRKIPYLVSLLLRNKLDTRKEVHNFKAQEATVYCKNSCNMDGEEVVYEIYHFEVLPKVLKVVF